MASSNIKLFDENKGNMLSDSEFSISTQRLNGLQTGVASSKLQNKAMYQASLVAYAIAQVMMQNGKNANDTDAVSTFVANLSGAMLQKVYDLATTEEAKAGVATGKWMSPALVKAAIDTLAAKAQNILSDTTKVLYGLDSSAVPNDVFVEIAKQLSEVPAASILVTGLSETDTVTATNGSKTLTGEWTQHIGSHIIKPIRDFGIWTVTATNGTKTATQDVLVDVITEYEIEMGYKLYLYRDGDECEDVTGGWSQRPANGLANATIMKTSTSISWTINVSLLRIATNNKIDLTNYKKLVFQCEQTVNGTVGGNAFIQGACSNPSSQTVTMGGEGTVASKTPQLKTTYGRTNIEVDISEITGSYYPYVRIDSGTSGLTITGVLYKVWLE